MPYTSGKSKTNSQLGFLYLDWSI